MRNVIGVIVFSVFVCSTAQAGVIADFDDLALNTASVWSGDYNPGGGGGIYDSTTFSSGFAEFVNYSDGDWGMWAGFAYSNQLDNQTAGWTNQFSTFAGSAHSGENFAVGYFDEWNGFVPTMILNSPMTVDGLYVTNTTYTGLALLNGEGPAKAFGGATGDDPDWFMLTIEGFDAAGASVGKVDYYLGDYRDSDNSLDYVVDTWRYVDLSSLGTVKSLEFGFSSSDVGAYGMNTPSYVAIDTVVPEPASLALLSLGGLLIRRKRR